MPLAQGATLAEALDFPGPWFASRTDGWTISHTDTHDGQDAVRFFKSTTDYAPFLLTTSVQGPGRLEFYHKSADYLNGTSRLEPLVRSDFGLNYWFGPHSDDWTHQVIDSIPPGPQRLSWTAGAEDYEQSANYGFDQVKFTPYQPTPLAAALNLSGITVTTSPDQPWQGWLAGNAAHDGTAAAISGVGSGSWLEITVGPEAGELSYFVRSPGNDQNFEASTGYDWFRSSSYIPRDWKEIRIPLGPQTQPRTIKIYAGRSAPIWVDQIRFQTRRELYHAWRAAHGLPRGMDSLDDSDGDSVPLLLEYAFGLNPNEAGGRDASAPSAASLPVFQMAEFQTYLGTYQVLQCQYFRRSGGAGPQYAVQFTSDPSLGWNATFSETVERWDDTWERVTVKDFDGPSSTKRFGRVQVVLD